MTRTIPHPQHTSFLPICQTGILVASARIGLLFIDLGESGYITVVVLITQSNIICFIPHVGLSMWDRHILCLRGISHSL